MKPSERGAVRVDTTSAQEDALDREDGESTAVLTDGGEADPFDLFTATADVPAPSRRERYGRKIEAYLLAPLRVAWSDWRARVGGAILLAFFLTGTLGVMLVPAPESLEGPIFLPPFQSGKFLLGTTISGTDLLEQTVHATPTMIKMIASGALFSIALATAVGTISGYKGGIVDDVLMLFTDVMLTMPGLVLVMVIASVFLPRDPLVVGLILGIDNWPGLARTIRSQVLSIREEPYVESSRSMDLPKRTIIRKDMISPLMPYISINLANSSRKIIFESVALYFLGILPFTTLNWGVMMNQAYNQASLRNPEQLHWLAVPMTAIILVSLGFVLFSQGLDRVFNVRLRAKHAKNVGGDGEESTPVASDR